jgi:hypothetical protein
VPVADPSELYGLPLDRFVAERQALAKKLRGEGNKDEAARVAALRKPSVAAWTVNQLARTQGPSIAALFDAGDELQRAQSDLLAGRSAASALRDAGRREREAVEELTEVARGLLSSDGHEPTQATLDRVGETLRAAALSEEARGEVARGCLARELRQVGFGAGDGAGLVGGGPGRSGDAGRAGDAGRGSDAGRAAAPDRKRAERAERERAAAAERERTEALRSARRAEAAARRAAEQAARQVDTAQERRDRAAEALREADKALGAARERADDAAAALRQAQAAAAELL